MSRFFPGNFSKSIIEINFCKKKCIYCLGYSLYEFVIYIEWELEKNIWME